MKFSFYSKLQKLFIRLSGFKKEMLLKKWKEPFVKELRLFLQ